MAGGGLRGGAFRAAALAAGVLAAAVVVEAALRVARPEAVSRSRLPTVYEPDAELGFRYRPGATGRLQRGFELDRTVSIDAAGWHDVAPDEGSAGPHLWVVGDSFTAGLHVPAAETWSRVLGAALRARGHAGASVRNLGLDGTGTDVHLAVARRELRSHEPPRALLVAFYANDVADVARLLLHREVHAGYVLQWQDAAQARAMRELAGDMAERAATRAIFDHLYLARLALYHAWGPHHLLRTNVISPSHVGRTPELRPPGPHLAQSFAGFAELGAARGFPVFVVPVPPRDEPGASLHLARRSAAESRLPVLDAGPALARLGADAGVSHRDLYWRGDAHFDGAGHRLFGAAVAEVLEPLLDGAAHRTTR